MTHPLDRAYRFETTSQWGAGTGFGFVLREGDGGVATMSTPGALRAERLPGTTGADGGSLLGRDLAGRVLWLRRDGTVRALDDAGAVRMARIAESLARGARRFLWGQRFGWVLTRDDVIRVAVPEGQRMGSFTAPGWCPEAIAADTCDGVLVVERAKDARRIRRVRADGLAHPDVIELPANGYVSSVREAKTGMLDLVLRGPGAAWHVLRVDVLQAKVKTFTKTGTPPPLAAGPIARQAGGAVALVDRGRRAVFEAGPSHVGPRRVPQWQDGTCRIGRIRDLLDDGEHLVAASSSGLWRLSDDPGDAPPERLVWLSPVLHSPLNERHGWQRADLSARLPEEAEITIAAKGFTAAALASQELQNFALGIRDVRDDSYWLDTPISRHFGDADGSEIMCRHYLGEVQEEFLVLRITVEVPACRGPVGVDSLRVLYPNRSLIEHLPPIFQDGQRSERQMRRALAGFQALVDEIDDTITAATHRVNPQKADALWSGFLLQWLGHGELARLPEKMRRNLLRALPGIMQRRGTKAGLARAMSVLAPEGFDIVDPASEAPEWLLPAVGDPAGARLGQDTRVDRLNPVPWQLGACQPLGQQPLGVPCRSTPGLSCSIDIIVRVFGDVATETRLSPFTDAVARLFAPANARLDFVFTDHRPMSGLGFGPGLDEITLGPDGSRALGVWSLPVAGDTGAPHQPARLNHSNLNGNLVLE